MGHGARRGQLRPLVLPGPWGRGPQERRVHRLRLRRGRAARGNREGHRARLFGRKAVHERDRRFLVPQRWPAPDAPRRRVHVLGPHVPAVRPGHHHVHPERLRHPQRRGAGRQNPHAALAARHQQGGDAPSEEFGVRQAQQGRLQRRVGARVFLD